MWSKLSLHLPLQIKSQTHRPRQEFWGSFFYTNFFDYPTPNSTTCWRPLPSTIPENKTNKQHSPLWKKKTYLPNCWLEGPLFLKFLRGVVFHERKTKIPHYELVSPFKMSKRLFKRVKPLNFMRPDFFGMWEIHGDFPQVECGVKWTGQAIFVVFDM